MASAYTGIIVLCALPGILAGLIHLFLSKKQNKTVRPGRITVFYVGIFYGLLSAVKMVFDGGSATLPESFQDIVPATYLHYMIPLLCLAVMLPIMAHLVLRRLDLSRFMSLTDSLMFFILALFFVVSNRICHYFYVAAILVSIVAALVVSIRYQGEISYCSKSDLKQRLQYAVPSTLFYVVTVILSLPGTLFLNNRTEILLPPSSFAKALLVGAGIYFCVIAGAGILLLTLRQLEWFYTLLFALTFVGYLQNMFLNGHMTSMDGKMQSWGNVQVWGNALIWILLIACIILLKGRLPINIGKTYRIICTYLSLVQLVSLGFLAVTSALNQEKNNKPSGEWILSTEKSLALHPDHNVLVFVLDWYDEQILEQILAQEPDFLSPLDGFTHYSNATSLYAFTEWSLPYLLTGVEWQYGMDKDEYREYAFQNSDMLYSINEAGYDVGVYTDLKYIGSDTSAQLCNYVLSEQYCRVWDTLSQMLKCSKYQLAPLGLKNFYWYTTDEITALARNDTYTPWITYNDVPFWTDITETGIDINSPADSRGSFRLYHMYGAHEPYVMSEDCTETERGQMLSQAKGSMKIVYEYISQLKALGLYDSATIIITADHGQNYTYDPVRAGFLPDMGLQTTSYPLLLVKNAGETRKGLAQSKAPVSHTELIASIADAIGIQTAADYGQTLTQIEETARRERIFTYMRNDMPYVKSAINGDAGNPDDWSVVEEK